MIKYSDLVVLTRIFVGKSCNLYLFDPELKCEFDLEEEKDGGEEAPKVLVNLGGEIERFKTHSLEEFDFIFDFSNKISQGSFKHHDLNFIQAPNGTVRWVFDKKDRKANFLRFYTNGTLRSKIIRAGIKLAVSMKLSKWVSQSFQLLRKQDYYFETYCQEINYDSFSVFTGTPGLFRKPIVQLIQAKKDCHYLKLAISASSKKCIERELYHLKTLELKDYNQFSIPTIHHSSSAYGMLTEAIAPSKHGSVKELNDSGLNAIIELMNKNMNHQKLSYSSFFQQITEHLFFLENHPNESTTKLLDQLRLVKDSIQANTYLYLSKAHGDLTPWNMARNENGLIIYDWEMSMNDAPLLYDVFHFIYQNEGLVKRKDSSSIKDSIQRLIQRESLAGFISKYEIDVRLNHQLYVLHALLSCLVKVNVQGVATADQEKMIANWSDALDLQFKNNLSHNFRYEFLEDLQQFLVSRRYAALKFMEKDFQSLPLSSDLDLLIDSSELDVLVNFIEKDARVKDVKVLKKSYMWVLGVHFLDEGFLNLDLIFDFIRKGQRYMDADAVLKYSQEVNGIMRPSLWDDIEYVQMFYTLNESEIPTKYTHLFLERLSHLDLERAYVEMINANHQLHLDTVEQAFQYSRSKKQAFSKFCARYNDDRRAKLKLYWSYVKDCSVEIKRRPGFIVTFSGVDGAGKTTIIQEVTSILGKKYRKEVVYLRHRPGLLPIISTLKYGSRENAEKKTTERLPRTGSNKSILSSIFRFAYYYTDYMIGQVYVYFRYIIRGKVVIYDRYYFDFINDSVRSNIRLNRRFIKALYRFIYKPKFNFYLYEEAEVILQRKKELDLAQIKELNGKYFSLFNEFSRKISSGKYLKIRNRQKNATVNYIIHQLKEAA